MNGEPLVSIVTPCLNPGERIARCLDSVAAQTYPNVEHIVVDGGSTDGTVELLQKRSAGFTSEPDRGQAAAINKGFALARGDWLGWLNADDILTPRSIELALAAIEATPGVGWAYGDCDLLRDGEQQSFQRPPALLDARALEGGNLIPQPGSLVARWALERVGPIDEEFELALDYDLWLRLALTAVPSVYVPEVLAVFELHGGSKSGSTPDWEFHVEEAVSLMKRGLPGGAILMFGRAAARAAQSSTGRVDRRRLDDEVAAVANRARRYQPNLEPRKLRAAAYAHAALLELHLRPRGVRYLLRPEPWLARDTRATLLRVIGRGAVRRLIHPFELVLRAPAEPAA